MEWLGEATIQIGADDAPPPAQVSPFLVGFVDGLCAHSAVRVAEVVEVDAFSAAQFNNPTRRVRFRFLAESYAAAQRLAFGDLQRTGLRAGVEALDPSLREFGWTISMDVQPI